MVRHTKSSDPVLELHNIEKRFGSIEILKNVNLTLHEGESVVILGPSGAGKSTMLHIAGLMDRPTQGLVKMDGSPVSFSNESDLARLRLNNVGFLFQFHYLLPDFNVLENVVMPARLAGDDLKAANREALHILTRLGLADRLNHKPYELSGGEQQRAGLARAIIRRPRILLCDEPTGNLDQATATEVAKLIWSEVEQEKMAAIVVTHNETIAKKADRVFHLSNGNFKEKD